MILPKLVVAGLLLAGCGASSTAATRPADESTNVPTTTDGRHQDVTSELVPSFDTDLVPDQPVSEVAVLDRPLVAVGTRSGDETGRIQLRLIELGFWLQGFDGRYNQTTKQAVMAFQKYSGLEPTGYVDDSTAFALTVASNRADGRAHVDGTVVEVDKNRQLMFLMVGGRLEWVINVSTGSGQHYREQNMNDPTKWVEGQALTPSGFFVVDRERPNGWWYGDLGEIYRPKYFNGGIAIHGSKIIPNYPASHGCVRVSTAAMDMIWDSGLVPKKTVVWVYGDDAPVTNSAVTAPQV